MYIIKTKLCPSNIFNSQINRTFFSVPALAGTMRTEFLPHNAIECI